MNKFIRLCVLFSVFIILTPAYAGLDYDYTSTRKIAIELSPLAELSTKEGITEGERVPFRVLKNVYDGKEILLKQCEIVYGHVETVITAGMNGFPAEIIIDNFEIPGIKASKLISEYSKTGQNRCLWVYPLKWALTPIPPTGSLTNFIFGGNAKLGTSDIVKIYYYPEWE